SSVTSATGWPSCRPRSPPRMLPHSLKVPLFRQEGPMPTDAELRTLFRELPAPDASINPTAIIRRSRRRRLPQQLGVGSVLTLAVVGIGFASITGLQGLAPSMMAADAPAGVAESS